MTALDIRLWEYLKNEVYAACPHCNQELKVSRAIITSIIAKNYTELYMIKTMCYILWRSSGTSNLQKEGNGFCIAIIMLSLLRSIYCSVSHSSLENTVTSLCTALYINNSIKLSPCQANGCSTIQGIPSLFRNSNLHWYVLMSLH